MSITPSPSPLLKTFESVGILLEPREAIEECVFIQEHTKIEKRLAGYFNQDCSFQLADDFEFKVLCDRISESVGEWQNLKILRETSTKLKNIDFAKVTCLLSPFWIKSPLTWDQHSGIQLIEHLLIAYEVPPFLLFNNNFLPTSRWEKPHALWEKPHAFKWLLWLIILGQGGSLKRATKFFNWTIPSKFPRYLWSAPSQLSPIEACLFAEIQRMGGSELDYRRIHSNRSFVLDPTEFSKDEPFRKFWHDTVRWLINHRDAITDEESEMILQWANHQYTEAERVNRYFSWKGRTVANVIQRSIEYEQERRKPWSKYVWEAHGWNWEVYDSENVQWSFVELTSGKELYWESQALHHCVTTYAWKCFRGNSAIVSLRKEQVRYLTIEIIPRTKRIAQVKGACNRNATLEEEQVISKSMRFIRGSDGCKG